MLCLSRHLQATFYSARSVINVNELRPDFNRLATTTNKCHVVYDIDRRLGKVSIAEGTFRSLCPNQFHIALGIHLKLFFEDSDVALVRLHVEARRIQGGVLHPRANNAWEGSVAGEGGGGGSTLLCIRHENVDGGHIELMSAKCAEGVSEGEGEGEGGGILLRRELSPAFLVKLAGDTKFRFAPTLSFDGTHDAIQDMLIITSLEPSQGPASVHA